MVGIGGIGSGIFLALDGNQTLGRDESRLGKLLNIRDYCKLHIISHYVAVLLGAAPAGSFRVIPIGKVGDDAPGRQMIREMKAAGMETDHVELLAGAPTLFSVCFQYPDGIGGNITTSNSAAAQLRPADVDAREDQFAGPAIALAAPEVPLATRAHFLNVATRHRAFRAASFAAAEVAPAMELGMFRNLDIVSLNEGEAAIVAGCEFVPTVPTPFLQACAKTLSASYPRLRFVVTAGSLGAFAFWQGAWDYCPAPKVPVASTAGAGDALLAGLLVAITAGAPFIRHQPSLSPEPRPLASALDFAVLLASYTVTSPHTIHPQADLTNLLAFAADLGLSLDACISRLLEPAPGLGSATQPESVSV